MTIESYSFIKYFHKLILGKLCYKNMQFIGDHIFSVSQKTIRSYHSWFTLPPNNVVSIRCISVFLYFCFHILLQINYLFDCCRT